MLTDTITEEDEEDLEEEQEAMEETLTTTILQTPSNEFLKTPGLKPSESNIMVGVRVRPLDESEDNVLEVADTQVRMSSLFMNTLHCRLSFRSLDMKTIVVMS